jgi:hypothetical protein
MSSINKPHTKHPHVYAIVRVDHPVDEEYPTNCITVVKVFSSEEAAGAEVTRLNQMNGERERPIWFASRD